MTNAAKITAVIAAGNFEDDESAASYAANLRANAERMFGADAEIEITVKNNQTGGGHISVEIDGEEDETAAEYLADSTIC